MASYPFPNTSSDSEGPPTLNDLPQLVHVAVLFAIVHYSLHREDELRLNLRKAVQHTLKVGEKGGHWSAKRQSPSAAQAMAAQGGKAALSEHEPCSSIPVTQWPIKSTKQNTTCTRKQSLPQGQCQCPKYQKDVQTYTETASPRL